MVNYVKVTNRKTFQSKIFPELNSKKHTVTNRLIFTKLRNCAKLEFRKSGIGQFCAKLLLQMIAKIVVFSHKTDAQRNKNFAFRSAKVLRMETLSVLLYIIKTFYMSQINLKSVLQNNTFSVQLPYFAGHSL